MCMGGQAATITQPDYAAYNQQFELQKNAIERQMAGGIQLKQDEMNAVVKQQQEQLAKTLDAKQRLAENTSAQAQRLAALIGPPPPEKSAEAPSLASGRGSQAKKGKSALRIGLDTAGRMGPGAGLNIT